MTGAEPQGIRCGGRLEVVALPGCPVVEAGADLAALVADGLGRAGIALADGDVHRDRVEGGVAGGGALRGPRHRRRRRTRPAPSADKTGKDARLCELILRESAHVSRVGPGALVVRHRLGFVYATRASTPATPRPRDAAPGSGPWALLLPADPDGTAARIRRALEARSGRGASAW